MDFLKRFTQTAVVHYLHSAEYEKGWLALHRAAEHGDIDRVKALAQHGDDVNAKDRGGWTALHVAATGGHSDTVKTLVQLGADVNATDKYGWTALHMAANGGHSDTVITLVECGADVNAMDEDGKSILTIAERKCDSGIVDVLQNPHFYRQICDKSNTSAQHSATIRGVRSQLLCTEHQRDEAVQERDDAIEANQKLASENQTLEKDKQELVRVRDDLAEKVVKLENTVTVQNEKIRVLNTRPPCADAETSTLCHGTSMTEATVSGGMQNEDKERLRRNYPTLVDNLDAKIVVDELFQFHVLSTEEMARVRAKKIPQDRTRVLLGILLRGDDAAYKCFRSALLGHRAQHKWLVRLLDNTQL